MAKQHNTVSSDGVNDSDVVTNYNHEAKRLSQKVGRAVNSHESERLKDKLGPAQSAFTKAQQWLINKSKDANEFMKEHPDLVKNTGLGVAAAGAAGLGALAYKKLKKK